MKTVSIPLEKGIHRQLVTLALVLSDVLRDSALFSHTILLSIWTFVPLVTGRSSIISTLKQEDEGKTSLVV